MTDIGDMTTADALAHYGVKGMKWGVSKKPSRTEILKARGRVQKGQMDLAVQRSNVRTAKRSGASDKKVLDEKLKLIDMKAKFLSNPDRVTAAHLSKGEAAVAALFLSPAVPAVNAIARGQVARRQAAGTYTKRASAQKFNARNAAGNPR